MEHSMQATIVRRYGGTEVLETTMIPRPTIQAQEVLVRVAATSVNPADWRSRNGQFRFFTQLPYIPGLDVAGVVEDVGRAVTRFKAGDAVYGMLPTMKGGGSAEYVAVAENTLAPIPTPLSFTEAAGIPLVALTSVQGLRDQARLEAGMHLLLNGASGGVGVYGLQIAKAMGATVTAVTSGRNAELVRGLGADHIVDYTQSPILSQTTRYDMIYDALGVRPFGEWKPLLTSTGTVLTVNPGYGNPFMQAWVRFTSPQRLASVFVQQSGADLEWLNGWIEKNQVRPVVEEVYALEEIGVAQKKSEMGRVRGKLVVVINQELVESREALSLIPAEV